MIIRGLASARRQSSVMTPPGDVLPRTVPGSAPPGVVSAEPRVGARSAVGGGRFHHNMVQVSVPRVEVCAVAVSDDFRKLNLHFRSNLRFKSLVVNMSTDPMHIKRRFLWSERNGCSRAGTRSRLSHVHLLNLHLHLYIERLLLLQSSWY